MILPVGMDEPEGNVPKAQLPLDLPRTSIPVFLQRNGSDPVLLARAEQHATQKFELGILTQNDGSESAIGVLSKCGSNVIKSDDRSIPVPFAQLPGRLISSMPRLALHGMPAVPSLYGWLLTILSPHRRLRANTTFAFACSSRACAFAWWRSPRLLGGFAFAFGLGTLASRGTVVSIQTL